MGLVLGFAIALLPLYTRISQFDVGRLSKDGLLLFVLAICLSFHRKDKLPPFLVAAPIMGLLFLALVNQWQPASMSVIHQVAMFGVGACFFVSLSTDSKRINLNHILNGASIGCLIQVFLGFADFVNQPIYANAVTWLTGAQSAHLKTGQITGSLGNSNLFASYVSITSISLLRRYWLYSIPLALIITVVSGSLVGIATVFGALVFTIRPVFISPLIAYLATVGGIVSLFLFGGFGIDTGRVKIWGDIFGSVDTGHLFFGRGLGWYADAGFLHNGVRLIHEHNELVSVFNAFGLIGLALMLIPLWQVVKRPNRGHFSTMFFAGFINSMGHFTWHQSTTALVLLASGAICISGRDNVINLEW